MWVFANMARADALQTLLFNGQTVGACLACLVTVVPGMVVVILGSKAPQQEAALNDLAPDQAGGGVMW